MKTTISILLFVGLLLAGILLPDPISSQNCNCSPHECCSQFGYCGTTEDYCGEGCKGGPCSLAALNNSVDVSGIVTNAFFNGIVAKSASTCPGRGFYTRDVFLRVIGDYPSFGRSGSIEDSKQEIAAFFAHVTDQTDHFCHIEALNGSSNYYCDTNYTDYPCVPNKHYYGRGPFQITWNYNYGAAGNSLGFDGLANPDIVANDSMISFKTALWFWMENVHSVVGEGFGATIRAINGDFECMNGEYIGDTVRNSVIYYTDYCKQFGVSTGDNLQCYTESQAPIELPIHYNLVLKNFGLYLK